MVKKIRFLSVVMMLGCLMSFGFLIDGHSQERSVSQGQPAAQESPGTQKPLENPRSKRVGILVTAEMNVAPLTYTGPCPTVFTLKGQIYASKAVTVLYKLVRSDNVPMKPIELKFEKEDRKEVTFTWQLGDDTGPVVLNEWAVIDVVYPVNTKIRSNIVYLKGSCTNQAGFKQQGVLSLKEEQNGPPTAPAAPTAFPGPLPPGKSTIPTGFPMPQPGQGGQALDKLPMPQPGQSGQGPGPGGLPMIQPGQKGPVPSGPPMLPGKEKGPMPGNFPMPQPDIKMSPGVEK